MLKAVLPFTARNFGRAILMPNLVPPVVTAADAAAYRERGVAARAPGSAFTPLMTGYLRDDTDPDDVERGFREGVFTGVKLYPAHATTNSAAGVTDLKNVYRVLERMQKIDMPFLMHGEVVDPDVDIFDRERVFIERTLIPLTKMFPGLRMILEHLSSKEGVDFGQGDQRALDEHPFPVENVDVGIHHLAMHQEGHVDLLHAFQHAVDVFEVGDARGRIRGCVGGIELDPGEHAFAEAALDVIRIGVVAQIAGHQRREGRTRRTRGARALPIGSSIR